MTSSITHAMASDDAELLRLMMAGDEQAFAMLYRKHQGSIYRFALLMSGSPVVAEEVTQEVFLILLREASRYNAARATLSAYLYGVARNIVRRCLERERLYVPLVDESEGEELTVLTKMIAPDDPLGNFTRNEVARLVRRAVLALPARYREVVVLCDFQEMSYREAAAALDCAIGTINSRLHRGHALLLKKLRAAVKLDSSSSDAQTMRCFYELS